MIGWMDPLSDWNDRNAQEIAARSSSIRRDEVGSPGIPSRSRLFSIVVLIPLFLLATGCQSWSPGAQIKQCQMESDRLLAEFRAQKKRADELEGKFQESQSRLAEAEKLLARVQNGNGRSSGVLADRSGIPSRSASSPPTAASPGGLTGSAGLPGRQTSNSDQNIHWRPQGTPLR